ncbi:hypothetical protein TNCV_764681 [Trichonephila clavipes]|nr:hypothetical protein TNCV_764681 [Trichonephila clavipes]
MPDRRIFHRLHRQLSEIHLFHVTRHDTVQRRAVRSSSLAKSVLNVVADRPESSTRARGVDTVVSAVSMIWGTTQAQCYSACVTTVPLTELSFLKRTPKEF